MEKQHTNPNFEVDFNVISVSIKKAMSKVNDSFFDTILFIKRNIIVIAILVVCGAVGGSFLDKGKKNYEHHIFVSPNFGSNSYLYSTIDLINAKIQERDSLFFKKIGVKNSRFLSKAEIKPVVEIYDYLDKEDEGMLNKRLDLFKIMSDNSDVEKLIVNEETSKNYNNHQIIITTHGKFDENELTIPLMNFLNSDSYFTKLGNEYRKKLDDKIAEKNKMIKQIDDVVVSFTSSRNNSGTMFYNDNTQLNELMKTRNDYVVKLEEYELDKVNYNKIVKDKVSILNQYKPGLLAGKKKIIFPIVLVLLFSFVVRFKKYYQRQLAKRQIEK